MAKSFFWCFKMFNRPFILVLSHDEVQISKGIPSLHPIVNLLCHQQFKITRELELIKIVTLIVPSTNNMLLDVQIF
jgi:hypothetical protein